LSGNGTRDIKGTGHRALKYGVIKCKGTALVSLL